jgi:antitoxin (DNA-binding transcriptional repressor) of toxin-antitoxin stability system
MAATLTIGMSDAKTNFSRLTADANRTGRTVVVFKNNKPWVEIRPLAHGEEGGVPAETREAMGEADSLAADPGHTTYKTAESLFSALGL